MTEIDSLLSAMGCRSLDGMIEEVVPAALRLRRPLNLPEARTEQQALADLRAMMSRNKIARAFLGRGYYGTIMPPVIQRNILENPGWYTAYTPYQAEISQGRLEALLNFQTMVCDLTAMEIANASLLDEATAAAEAMTMCRRLDASGRRNTFVVSPDCHPQTIAVVQTRAEPLGIQIASELTADAFGLLLQYPTTDGAIRDYAPLIAEAHKQNTLVVVATDLLALTLIKPPGEWGADIVVGNSQRFGVPLGYGGPHAAFFATRNQFKRQMPGRLIGVARDAQGHRALRLALQTREQHIRREKATSNICTSQVLPAVLASLYAVWHGPEGLRRIAERVHRLTCRLAQHVERDGDEPFFDTLRAGNRILALDETTTDADVDALIAALGKSRPTARPVPELGPLARTTPFLTQEVFQRYHTEHEMLRYIHRLESKDLALNTAMIPLGSCTMKLTPTAAMLPLSWPEVNSLHPLAPDDEAAGYRELFRQLASWLAEITGLPAVSLQPNAGSQGEYAGLLTFRAYHRHRGEPHRDICLIPVSAHGTNPASAVMAGFQVVPVACDPHGNVDITDLRSKAALHAANLGALMVTYPSTHGVFEEGIVEICQIIHEHGGQVYMDGANMNAMIGLCRPADIGADVCHLNLHKSFGIPHGGGGPGVGPICAAEHLADFLPRHVAAAPHGSASILTISWMYIAMHGPDGLTDATKRAILNANYIAKRLAPYFPTLYKGARGFVAHECILDLREWKTRAGVDAEDVAKRLMDYGFHAPTMSWPVPGTLMVEPTESESKAELDRFCEAMIAIHGELETIARGQWPRDNNPLKNAPHTAEVCCADHWDRPYSRELAAFPTAWTRQHKFWPAVGRVDNVYGDRNLFCTCPPTA